MARHRRGHRSPLVRRSTYRALERRYDGLSAAYAALEADHRGVLEDHEGLLFELEEAEPPPEPLPHVPSWAETEEIPLITSVGLDADKAVALARNTGMLRRPGGAWGGGQPGTTG